ncbi:methyl-accepting chemotaxis protein [Fundidesulfovibrio agrisoli]|uniref:methyl-accepting chemotaxis protein n=1 Tax=Fundidesulfovibrio agrisoli TaxID=2922717 RepID=UPI00243602E1|nr:methyl-accepting chemotaxis protein [Fundidesulfovibrio agrisoli]
MPVACACAALLAWLAREGLIFLHPAASALPQLAVGLAAAALAGWLAALPLGSATGDAPRPEPAPSAGPQPHDGRLGEHAARVGDLAGTLAERAGRAGDEAFDLTAQLGVAGSRGSQALQTLAAATQGMEHARELSRRAGQSLDELAAAMERVLAGAGGAQAKLTVIADTAEQAQSLVAGMADIAEQTDMLSLNASIEAEKAGEHGRGFGVVAKAVRRLADTAAQTAGDFERLVARMRQAVAADVMEMDTLTRQAGHGAARLRASREAVRDAAGALEELALALEGLGPELRGLPPVLTKARETSDRVQGALAALPGLAETLRATAEGLAGLDAPTLKGDQSS